MENSKKCPLCKKKVYMKNGRYACEDCGYIINTQVNPANEGNSYSVNISQVSASERNVHNGYKVQNRNNNQKAYGAGYNPYAANNKTTFTDGSRTVYTSNSVNNTGASVKSSLKKVKGVFIAVFLIMFIVPTVFTFIVGYIGFNQISNVVEHEEVSIEQAETTYVFDDLYDIDDFINTFDDEWSNGEAADNDRVLPYSDLYKDFVSEIFGKSYDTVTEDEYASVTYLHPYYYEDKIEYAINDGEIQVYIHDGTKYDYLDKDIRCFTGLKVLNVEKDVFYNDDSLEGLANLEEIWTGNTPEELAVLVDNPEKIKILGLNDSYYMTTLSGIENFPEVTKLYVKGNYLEELTGLASLTKLTDLTIEYANSVSNFTDLAKIEYLEKLKISSNKLKNLSFLENMTGLRELSICETYVTDISKLSRFSGTLEKLELLDNYDLEDCGAIEELTKLKELSLYLGLYSDVPDFSKLENLTCLYLYGAGDITNVGEAKKLTELTMESCNIENLSALSKLSNVKYLKISRPNSYLEDLSAIRSMTSIETLDISSLSVYGNVEYIFSLPKLKAIYMDDAWIGIDLDKVEKNEVLSILNMNDCKLRKYVLVETEYYDYTDYEEIDISANMNLFLKFPNLSELYVAELGIDNVEVFGELSKLKLLDISKNNVSSLKPLANLTMLDCIWCGDNTIIDSDELNENVELIFEQNY